MSSSTPAPSKATTERHQRILLELLKEPGNQNCADCHTRNPRWASWNLGIFICVKCAGIHRKLGTHITKVKSLTLDSWTKEQIQSMKQLGNLKANQIYNPNGPRNPPPTDLEESERDSQLEKYIRAKYEAKRFIDSHRKHSSISSGRTSVSSAISSIISTSPAPSPASSIFRQSPRTQPAIPNRPPTLAPARAVEIPSRPPERSVTANAQLPIAPQPVTSQPQLVSRDTSSVYYNPQQSPQPPLRPSTAPIPSDGYHGSQSTPPVPSLNTHSGHHAFQRGMTKNQDVNQPNIFHQSLNLSNQPFHQVPPINNPPSHRTDGVWGDLMQLTEPNTNPSQPSSGFLGHHPSYNKAYQPLTSTHLSNNMNGLEAGMSRLMYTGTPMTPATPGTQNNQATNPFSTYAPYNPTGFQPGVQSQPPLASYSPAGPSSNPFCTHPSPANPATAHPLLNSTPAPNRNPFLNSNLQNFAHHPDAFAAYHPTAHQHPSPLSVNQHSPFFS